MFIIKINQLILVTGCWILENIRYSINFIKNDRASRIRHSSQWLRRLKAIPYASIQYPVSSIQYPVSSIKHRLVYRINVSSAELLSVDLRWILEKG